MASPNVNLNSPQPASPLEIDDDGWETVPVRKEQIRFQFESIDRYSAVFSRAVMKTPDSEKRFSVTSLGSESGYSSVGRGSRGSIVPESPLHSPSLSSGTNSPTPPSIEFRHTLVLGDGNFSYSVDLVNRYLKVSEFFGHKLVATEKASYKELKEHEKQLPKEERVLDKNIEFLLSQGVLVLFGVDGTKIHETFKGKKFKRIQWNCPDLGKGFEGVAAMLKEFFKNARHVLLPHGKIHMVVIDPTSNFVLRASYLGLKYALAEAALLSKPRFFLHQVRKFYSETYRHKHTSKGDSAIDDEENLAEYIFAQKNTGTKNARAKPFSYTIHKPILGDSFGLSSRVTLPLNARALGEYDEEGSEGILEDDAMQQVDEILSETASSAVSQIQIDQQAQLPLSREEENEKMFPTFSSILKRRQTANQTSKSPQHTLKHSPSLRRVVNQSPMNKRKKPRGTTRGHSMHQQPLEPTVRPVSAPSSLQKDHKEPYRHNGQKKFIRNSPRTERR